MAKAKRLPARRPRLCLEPVDGPSGLPCEKLARHPGPHLAIVRLSPEERLVQALRENTRALQTRRMQPADSRPAARSTKRGKLSPEALRKHIELHPIGKRNADGSHFSVNQRRAALQREQGVKIDRSTLTKRLPKPPSS
jgi:hypothetical protein